MRTRLTVSVAIVLGWIAYVGLAAEQLASRSTEEWIKTLDAPERVAGLRVDDVIARLKIAPGMVVVDLGAGTGAFTLPLVRAVGPAGKVYAVEIERGLVDHVARKAADAGLTNVQSILGKPEDPGLPGPVDLAFMNDVLHHVADRAGYIKRIAASLKPGARFAVIDPEPVSSPHKGDPALVVSIVQATQWLQAAGLVQREDVKLFSDRWFVIYEKK
jgi:ubiquinone/menaquinone biosynthesis C-methylase UbiE